MTGITGSSRCDLIMSFFSNLRRSCTCEISHSLPSRAKSQVLRHDWCMIINYYKATRHYQLPPQKQAKPNSLQLSSCKHVRKRKWKIGRYRRKSHAKKAQTRPGIFCKSLGNQQSTPFIFLSSPVCPRPALHFFVSVSRFNRFSGSMQYICRIVSAADVHGYT